MSFPNNLESNTLNDNIKSALGQVTDPLKLLQMNLQESRRYPCK